MLLNQCWSPPSLTSRRKPSQVVDQRTSDWKPLLAPIVLVSFHLSSGPGEEEKNGAEKWGRKMGKMGQKNGVENDLGSTVAGVDALKIKLFLKNELFKLFNNSQNKIDSRECLGENWNFEQSPPAQLHAMTVSVQYRKFTESSRKSQVEPMEGLLASMDPFGQNVWHRCFGLLA
jgi:hypothetical protein